MRRALVTGGAGFIGSHTVDALLARGFEVRVLDLLLPPVHDGNVPSYVPREVEFIKGDVRDPTCMRRALRDVQVVYHMAAYQDYLPDFSTFFTTNAGGTALLYELIIPEFHGIELVVVASSQAVYGEGRYRCPADGIVYPGPRSEEQLGRGEWDQRCPTCSGLIEPEWTDERVMRPHNAYGLSKRDEDEIAITLGRRYRIPSVAFRYSIVQGPRQSFRNAYSGALRAFTVCALNDAAPVLFEDGAQLRDYVSIHDVVEANMLPLSVGSLQGQSFNVGGNRRLTVSQLAQTVIGVVGSKAEPRLPGLFRVGDTRHVFSDVAALKAFGWAPRVNQQAIVEEYVKWASEQPDLHNTYEDAEERMRALGVLQPVRKAG